MKTKIRHLMGCRKTVYNEKMMDGNPFEDLIECLKWVEKEKKIERKKEP